MKKNKYEINIDFYFQVVKEKNNVKYEKLINTIQNDLLIRIVILNCIC